MAFEEKRAWIMVLTTVASYLVYLAVVLGRARHMPLVEVPYAAALLWSIGGAVVAAIVLNMAAGSVGSRKTDQRDREIRRAAEYIGQSFVVLGGTAALFLALARVSYFWIANVLYLGFALSAVLGSVGKIFAYRRGFQSW